MEPLITILLGVAGAVFMMTTAILGWALKIIRANILKDVANSFSLANEAIRESKEIRSNYISRFERLKDAINNSNDKLMDRINLLERHINERYVRRQDCPLIHESRKGE